MATPVLQVTGLKELRAALAKASEELPNELGRANRLVADYLAAAMRGDAPHRTGRLAASIRASSSTYSAKVTGGSGVPYFGLQEFGGVVPRRGFKGTHGHVTVNPSTGAPAVTHIKAYRGNTKGDWWDDDAGYFMYRGARQHRDQVLAMYEAAVQAVVDRI